MKIVSIASRTEQFALTRPYAIAYKSLAAVTNIIVEIRTDDGRVGLGAVSPSPFVTGETVGICAAALAPARIDFLFGRDVHTLPALCRDLERQLPEAPAARAALDMALHDLLAQACDLPLVELLGRAHDTLPTSITIGLMGVDETLAEAREYLDRGFRCLKVKLGREVGEDIARVVRLREAIGHAATLRVDANQGWTRPELARFLRESARAELELIEQPLAAADVDGLRAVPDAERARLCADEALRTPADAWALTRPPAACGIFNLKLVKCGGIRPALRIAEIADLAGVSLMWGCMDESVISIAAALHAALACPATRFLDLDGSLDLARDVATGGFTLEDGLLRTTDRPGLGVTVSG